MAVRKNGYYQPDPALAASFDNLASAFATPSGADIANFAKAGSERQKAAALADLLSNPNDPNFDRKNIILGNLTGTNSIAAQNQNDATARRGQDVVANTGRDVANINNAGQLARQFANPIGVKDGETMYLPAQTAAATGLPSMFRGNVTTAQGSTVTTPTGEVLAGPVKPLSETEIKGAILGRQTPEFQRAVVGQGVSVVPVAGKDGEPTNVLPIDAQGRTPYTPDTTTRQLGTYKSATGEGNVYFDRDKNKWIDTATGGEPPPGVPVKSIAPGTQVNIETKAPSKIEDAYGEGVGAQIKSTMDNAGAAPRSLAEIAQFRDALARAGDNITTGPFANYVLKGKQAIGGIVGSNLDGVPEAELINNIGYKLAAAAARSITSRPTQFEFGQALLTKPGLANSKPGMQAMLNIMEQNARDDQALAVLANDPANRQNWTATVQKFYAEHPVMSPFEPGKPLGQSDIARLESTAGADPAPAAAPAAGASATPAAAPATKPATVTQGGHTYTLQPDGSYK